MVSTRNQTVQKHTLDYTVQYTYVCVHQFTYSSTHPLTQNQQLLHCLSLQLSSSYHNHSYSLHSPPNPIRLYFTVVQWFPSAHSAHHIALHFADALSECLQCGPTHGSTHPINTVVEVGEQVKGQSTVTNLHREAGVDAAQGGRADEEWQRQDERVAEGMSRPQIQHTHNC